MPQKKFYKLLFFRQQILLAWSVKCMMCKKFVILSRLSPTFPKHFSQLKRNDFLSEGIPRKVELLSDPREIAFFILKIVFTTESCGMLTFNI